jgi:hypothetical protein
MTFVGYSAARRGGWPGAIVIKIERPTNALAVLRRNFIFLSLHE